MSFNVLQVTRLSVCTSRNESMPDRLDRVIAPRYRPTIWTSVSVIFRWRPHRDHSDEVSRNPSLTIHALRWQRKRVDDSPLRCLFLTCSTPLPLSRFKPFGKDK